jgi:cell wall assembly regulator SMI1
MTLREQLQGMGAEPGDGATAAEIRRAESQLGVTFPPSYSTFLRDVGWLSLPGLETYGLGRGTPDYYELVRSTLDERHVAHPHLPPHLLPFMNDGAGNHYCLDTSQKNELGECPVVFWDHEAEDGPDQTPAQVAPDFHTWLLDELRDLSVEQAA